MPALHVIRFGIPSVDELFGATHNALNPSAPKYAGIHLPQKDSPSKELARELPGGLDAAPPSSVSLCITGPGGTGKSILAMHLASRYVADCWDANNSASKVLYVSTDLKFEVAANVWRRFGLNRPNSRVSPFDDEPQRRGETNHEVELRQCYPLQSPEEQEDVGRPLSNYLASVNASSPEVYFVDLASNTAGDDWGFVSRVLSVVERQKQLPPHLMIIDSVEGFETLVGERDAFGESQPRRSRVAQILRAAGEKCHIVFIVEEPKEGEHLPEEFVTDVVARLRSISFRDYGRRTIEIIKSRGQAHVRGQHILLIRPGSGSTTGNQENYDDPKTRQLSDGSHQSYIHVCASLHHLNRKIMVTQGEGRPANPPPKYAAFGIRYLDNMLASKVDDFRRDATGDDQRGLLCRTITALIGNSQTQKSPLGYAFLSRCFRSYAQRFADNIKELSKSPGEVAKVLAEWASAGGEEVSCDRKWASEVLARFAKKRLDETVIAAALKLGPPREDAGDGIPILLTTQDLHAEILVREFLPWLLRKVPALAENPDHGPQRGCEAALAILMEERTICRRLEIHDMPSAVLIHIVQRSIETAQRFMFKGDLPIKAEERFDRSFGIRVVIDDLSILRHTYAEFRDDPLLLRYLVFLLGREGVTTLLVDTQEGHPHLTVPSGFDSELRSLVAGHIYTWRFPFYESNRVAIAAIPPMRPRARSAIRELRQGTQLGSGPEATPLVVDPHFEFYSGIETGQPKPIPLVIRLYEEMPSFSSYISDQNTRCSDFFTPLGGEEGSPIIHGVPGEEYQRLFELASTQKATLLDHTLIFQVDEFWSMRRPGVRRSGAARPLWDYLQAKTSNYYPALQDKPERIWAVDSHDWYQRSLLDGEIAPVSTVLDVVDPLGISSPGAAELPHRRADSFVVQGYTLMEESCEELVDRVPFMWDFGFLLCRIRPWEEKENQKRELLFLKMTKEGSKTGGESERFRNVADVWENMILGTKDGAVEERDRPSWRVFLEACYQLAKVQNYSTSHPTQAFDLQISSIAGLSCLLLEIWASEIYKGADAQGRAKLVELVSHRKWEEAKDGLIEWLDSYKEQLFRSWLLLIEVLDLKELAAAIAERRLGARRPNPNTLAVRHWYKTAWSFTQNKSGDDPVIPVGLPGNFSIRGDWFLAVAGGGRSERLADQALDFLNTQSANYERLHRGLGLPVRRIVTDHLRTGILTLDRGDIPKGTQGETEVRRTGRRVSSVHYENLIHLGGPVQLDANYAGSEGGESFYPKDFNWLWRSRLAHFSRHNRVWHEWLYQTVVWWNRMREIDGGQWINGFQRYDKMVGDPKKNEAIRSWKHFQERCEHLVKELKGATLA
jgi:KaiC/GvpD/RAD55 family RecA-like ATPase